MKYSATLSRKDGKTVVLSANEYIDIDVKDGNRLIASMTVRDGHVYNASAGDVTTARGIQEK